jgi:hypothetical protein
LPSSRELAEQLLGLTFAALTTRDLGEIKAKLLFSAYGSEDMPGDLQRFPRSQSHRRGHRSNAL